MISTFEEAGLLPPTPVEQVLVIHRSIFDDQEAFQGFRVLGDRPDLGIYLQGAPVKHAYFMDRAEAEQSRYHKQLLPYVVIMSGERILTYRRGKLGGENRLHGKLSIGFGGHVNPDDDPDEPFWAMANGTIRELLEETGLKLTHDALQRTVIGLVNDDSNPVGEVHLGVVSVIAINERQAEEVLHNCENTVVDAIWTPIQDFYNEVLYADLETWSQYVIAHLLAEWGREGKWGNEGFRERITMLAVAAGNIASSAASFLLQENPKAHLLVKADLEESIGALQCLVSGLCANEDIDQEKVKEAAHAFHSRLNDILKHQHVDAQS